MPLLHPLQRKDVVYSLLAGGITEFLRGRPTTADRSGGVLPLPLHLVSKALLSSAARSGPSSSAASLVAALDSFLQSPAGQEAAAGAAAALSAGLAPAAGSSESATSLWYLLGCVAGAVQRHWLGILIFWLAILFFSLLPPVSMEELYESEKQLLSTVTDCSCETLWSNFTTCMPAFPGARGGAGSRSAGAASSGSSVYHFHGGVGQQSHHHHQEQRSEGRDAAAAAAAAGGSAGESSQCQLLQWKVHSLKLVHKGLSKQDRASKPVFLLLHGHSAGAAHWEAIFHNVSTLCREVHVLDFPGWGRSPCPPALLHKSTTPFLLARIHTEMLKAWCKENGIEKAIVMGHSLGGFHAINFTHACPELVQQLILVCPAGVLPLQPEQSIALTLYFSLLPPQRIARTFGRLGLAIFKPLYNALLDEDKRFPDYYYQLAAATGVQGMGKGDHLAGKFLRSSGEQGSLFWAAPAVCKYMALKPPVSLIWGQKDDILPPTVAGLLHRIRPDTDLYYIAKALHNPAHNRPEAFCAAIADCISRHAAARAAAMMRGAPHSRAKEAAAAAAAAAAGGAGAQGGPAGRPSLLGAEGRASKMLLNSSLSRMVLVGEGGARVQAPGEASSSSRGAAAAAAASAAATASSKRKTSKGRHRERGLHINAGKGAAEEEGGAAEGGARAASAAPFSAPISSLPSRAVSAQQQQLSLLSPLLAVTEESVRPVVRQQQQQQQERVAQPQGVGPAALAGPASAEEVSTLDWTAPGPAASTAGALAAGAAIAANMPAGLLRGSEEVSPQAAAQAACSILRLVMPARSYQQHRHLGTADRLAWPLSAPGVRLPLLPSLVKEGEAGAGAEAEIEDLLVGAVPYAMSVPPLSSSASTAHAAAASPASGQALAYPASPFLPSGQASAGSPANPFLSLPPVDSFPDAPTSTAATTIPPMSLPSQLSSLLPSQQEQGKGQAQMAGQKQRQQRRQSPLSRIAVTAIDANAEGSSWSPAESSMDRERLQQQQHLQEQHQRHLLDLLHLPFSEASTAHHSSGSEGEDTHSSSNLSSPRASRGRRGGGGGATAAQLSSPTSSLASSFSTSSSSSTGFGGSGSASLSLAGGSGEGEEYGILKRPNRRASSYFHALSQAWAMVPSSLQLSSLSHSLSAAGASISSQLQLLPPSSSGSSVGQVLAGAAKHLGASLSLSGLPAVAGKGMEEIEGDAADRGVAAAAEEESPSVVSAAQSGSTRRRTSSSSKKRVASAVQTAETAGTAPASTASVLQGHVPAAAGPALTTAAAPLPASSVEQQLQEQHSCGRVHPLQFKQLPQMRGRCWSCGSKVEVHKSYFRCSCAAWNFAVYLSKRRTRTAFQCMQAFLTELYTYCCFNASSSPAIQAFKLKVRSPLPKPAREEQGQGQASSTAAGGAAGGGGAGGLPSPVHSCNCLPQKLDDYLHCLAQLNGGQTSPATTVNDGAGGARHRGRHTFPVLPPAETGSMKRGRVIIL